MLKPWQKQRNSGLFMDPTVAWTPKPLSQSNFRTIGDLDLQNIIRDLCFNVKCGLTNAWVIHWFPLSPGAYSRVDRIIMTSFSDFEYGYGSGHFIFHRFWTNEHPYLPAILMFTGGIHRVCSMAVHVRKCTNVIDTMPLTNLSFRDGDVLPPVWAHVPKFST